MIPNQIVKEIKRLKTVRSNYFEFYKKWLAQEKERQILTDKEQATFINCQNFTLEELVNLSTTLKLKNKPKEKNDYHVMLRSASPHRFTNFDNNLYQIHDDHDYPTNKSERAILTPQEQYKQMFMDAIHFIYKLDIKIYNIEYSDEFIFHCQKGNVKVLIKCRLNQDYKKGYLYVNETINGTEKIKHDVTFNLKYLIKDYGYIKFVKAMNGESMNSIKQSLYSHIIALPKLLNCEVKDDYFNTDNENEIENYFIRIDDLILTPINHETIYLSLKKFKPYRNKDYKVQYKSLKDFDQLVNYIDAFLKRLNGYGYGGNDLTLIKHFPHLKINVARDVDNLSGFDVFIVLNGYQENSDALMTYFNIPKINSVPCILDYYGIRFRYDPRIDPLNCVLTTDCQSCDLTKLQYTNTYTPYHDQLKSFDFFTIHDSYQNCVNVIEALLVLLNDS